MTPPPLCPLHSPGHDQVAADSSWLCARHTAAVGTLAAGLPVLHDGLAVLRPGIGGQGGGPGGSDRASPIHVPAVDLQIEIKAIAVSWCRLVAEERGLGLPTTDTIAAACGFLALHGDWLGLSATPGRPC